MSCDEILRFDDCTNFMKAAIVTADRVTTVSETYAQELRYPYYSHGLDGVLQSRGVRLLRHHQRHRYAGF